MIESKTCKKCNKTKELAFFSRHSSTKDKHSNVCKECDNIRNKQWYLDNKQHKLNLCKEYKSKNKEKISLAGKEYYQKTKEEYLQRQKRYRDSNKSKGAAKRAKYRASLLKRTPKWLTSNDLAVIDAKYAMAKWLSEIVGIKYEVDHVVPLQGKLVSGLHTPDNLAIIKSSINRSKGNRHTI